MDGERGARQFLSGERPRGGERAGPVGSGISSRLRGRNLMVGGAVGDPALAGSSRTCARPLMPSQARTVPVTPLYRVCAVSPPILTRAPTATCGGGGPGTVAAAAASSSSSASAGVTSRQRHAQSSPSMDGAPLEVQIPAVLGHRHLQPCAQSVGSQAAQVYRGGAAARVHRLYSVGAAHAHIACSGRAVSTAICSSPSNIGTGSQLRTSGGGFAIRSRHHRTASRSASEWLKQWYAGLCA